MTAYARLVRDALEKHVVPALTAMGFVRAGRRQAWTEGRLQVRSVVDSKAKDPFRGGAFNLEFEVSDNDRFEEKLAGRVRIDQLLDDAQRVAAEHLAAIHPSIHEQYLKPFQQVTELERGHAFWMRFRTSEDLDDWCGLIVSELPTLLERARSLPAHELILGKPLEW
jgi:hypothetical protein